MTPTDLEERDGVQVLSGAGTPSRFPADTLEALEFQAALDLVAEHAAGPLGAARVRGRRPEVDPAAVAEALATVRELLDLRARGDSVDIPPMPEIAGALRRLRVAGSVLNGVELLAIRRALTAGRLAARELGRVAADAPRAAALVVPLPSRSLDERLEQALDDDGELLDGASPRLARARRAVHDARERLVKKLDQVLKGLDPQAVPPGAQSTIRDGRYVIPVRRDSRARPQGIIHDESASHGTLFVEPTDAIEFGNALRSAVADAEREAMAVLRELTDLCRPEADTIDALHEMGVAADDLLARVRYAHAAGAAVPAIGAAGLIVRQGRHPLLLARGLEVVPVDLELGADERTLLVSGPNAGGKTVLLKTVGLAALLAQAGVVPPVGAGTVLPVFRRMFADIGDHQSLAADLSTFSAHVAALRIILEQADDQTLVLMDEMGSGTDPMEGAALAAATLRALTAKGTTSLVTTHLGALKTLAGEVAGVVNGSLAFDADELRPTFRFSKGVPGRSYGIAIARRLGVDPAVVDEAARSVPERERALDELLARVETRARDLEAREAVLGERLELLEAREGSVEARESLLKDREERIRRREKDAEREGRREARRHLLDARDKVEEAIRLVRSAETEAAARTARRIVEDAVQAEAVALEELDAQTRPADAAPVAVGQRVRVGGGAVGSVLELRADGRALVALGSVKMVVAPEQLTLVAEGPAARQAPPEPSRPDIDAPSEIDLRGLTGDEAHEAVIAALDAAVLADRPFLRIIHGMGTGVVRDRVRRVLQKDRRVAKFDFAPRQLGGTGVTIAELTS